MTQSGSTPGQGVKPGKNLMNARPPAGGKTQMQFSQYQKGAMYDPNRPGSAQVGLAGSVHRPMVGKFVYFIQKFYLYILQIFFKIISNYGF